MKKLFVLFLLAALVPFTIGCGLFGDNDDTTPVTVTKLTASAILPAPAGASIRAAAVAANLFKGYTMTINGVTLTAETEELINGEWKVTFGAIVSATQLATAQQGLVPVTIVSNTGVSIVSAYINTENFAPTAPIAITVSSVAGVITIQEVTVGNTSTPVVAADTTVTILSAVAGAGTKPTFTIVFDKDIVSTLNATIDVDVRNVKNSVYTNVASSVDFSTPSYTATTKTMEVTLSGKTLVVGQTYEVVVRNIKTAAGLNILSKTFTFTAK